MTGATTMAPRSRTRRRRSGRSRRRCSLLTPEILAARWDPANPAAKEVYGFRPDDETRDYAVDYYTQVRELVLRLAETGSGLFVGIF
jgi:hypothetical protein